MRSARCLLVIGVLLLCGCGGAGGGRTTVGGKVVYKGEPVPSGTVAFVNDTIVTTGQIQNGQYSIPNVAVGENKISVTTPPAPGGGQMQLKQKVEGKSLAVEPVKSVAVPSKYSRPESSGLTYTATSDSKQTYDIELKD